MISQKFIIKRYAKWASFLPSTSMLKQAQIILHLLLHLVVRDEDGGGEGEPDCEGQEEAGVGDGEVGAPQQPWGQPSVMQ